MAKYAKKKNWVNVRVRDYSQDCRTLLILRVVPTPSPTLNLYPNPNPSITITLRGSACNAQRKINKVMVRDYSEDYRTLLILRVVPTPFPSPNPYPNLNRSLTLTVRESSCNVST